MKSYSSISKLTCIFIASSFYKIRKVLDDPLLQKNLLCDGN